MTDLYAFNRKFFNPINPGIGRYQFRDYGALCIRRWRWCDDWYTNGHFCCFDCLLTVFDRFGRLVHCWYSKNDHRCTNRHRSAKTVPTVYQSSKKVKRQSKQQKWPLVYQSSHVYTESTKYTTSASASAVRVRRIHKANYGIGEFGRDHGIPGVGIPGYLWKLLYDSS